MEKKNNFTNKATLVCLVSYIYCLFQIWHLCKVGGLKIHLIKIVIGMIIFLTSLFFWYKNKPEKSNKNKKLKIILVVLVTIFFGLQIIYLAMPYNGALSWKIDEWRHKKEVTLKHDNILNDGVNGLFLDLDTALKLPEKLYIVNDFKMTFDQKGNIKTINTFIYGKDKEGATKTYLIDYDISKNEKIEVYIDNNVNATYDEDLQLAPLLTILDSADYKQQISLWSQFYNFDVGEILYYGRRCFDQSAGLVYLAGDVDGDGIDKGTNNFMQLNEGGKIVGYEVSLHMPSIKIVTPVRYIMEPEYISLDEVNQEHEDQQIAKTKQQESWQIDQNDGSAYFFFDDYKGWRLKVTDAAAGSRFYVLEKTEDGGNSWFRINENPFANELGVVEGIEFFDDNFGFIGITGASKSSSNLFVTNDGGISFKKLELPFNLVTALPAKLTIADFDYYELPIKNDGVLIIKVRSQADASDEISFASYDNGQTWQVIN